MFEKNLPSWNYQEEMLNVETVLIDTEIGRQMMMWFRKVKGMLFTCRPRKDEVVGSSHTSPHVSLPQKRHVGQLESPTTTKTPQCHGIYNDPYGIGHSYDDNRNGVIGTSSRHSKDNSVNLLSSFDDVNDSESHEYGEDDMIDDENEIDENGEDFSNSEDAIENDTVMSHAHRVNCEVSNPSKLWGDHINDFSDDIIWMRRRTLKNDELMLSEEEIHHWALAELERILNCIGKSLRSYADMPFPPPEFLCGISNTLIAEERSYDIQTMMVEHQQLHSSLNADQMIIYDAVIESVYNKRGKAIDQTTSTSTVIDQKPVFETLNFLDLNLPAPDEGNDTSVIEFSPWWIESNHQHDSFLDDMIDDENEIDENGEDFSNSEDAIENDTVMSQAHRDDMINDENGEEFANSEDAIDNDIVTSDAHRVNCEVSNPSKLWGDHINDFSDDIIWMRRRTLKNDELMLSEEEIHHWALAELERILNCIGKSLRSYADMPFPPPEFLCGISNTLIAEERSYDIQTMMVEHQQLHSSLNADQMIIYDAVIESVYNKRGKVFFVYGSGGCGKTFLWRTIISRMRSTDFPFHRKCKNWILILQKTHIHAFAGLEFVNGIDFVPQEGKVYSISNFSVDLMGLVQNRLPMQSRNTQTGPKDVLLFDISDGSSTVKVTVWADLAHKLNEELDEMLGQDNIIIITSCGITEYHGM
ncbi:hypothetical protein POM88_038746 [Heracleum sosnowskyi]|uniref:ATP-dependent DNA helicase n=1 Tax=Heracleum sosnowskyi TaxID=360622 RepID=A0AAD8H929_9APIA|nr:hypothetical protein POM88_038746 [Heracleum sosnowskyi]